MTQVESFRAWLHNLSHEDLLCAMEFDIPETEYSLIQEMVKLQAPPPTPIHPGILGYRPASVSGATDGRNEEERVYKARFETPRMFQLMETASVPSRMATLKNGRSARRRTIMPSTKRYDVIARRKITSWGEVLSIGCTQEQRDADDELLKGTRIHHSNERNRCTFCSTESNTDVLRILQVASRGKFASVPPTSSSTPPFCASWMNAQLEWFSLPMFLASRFEVALWSSFRNRASRTLTSWSDPIQGVVEKLHDSALENAFLSATVHALLRDIFPKDEALRLIRDSVIWNLLDTSTGRNDNENGTTRKEVLQRIGTVTIVDLDSSKHKFQTAVWSQLQETLAAESEKEILRSLENEAAGSPMNTDTSSRRKKAKNKKKKRRAKDAAKAETKVVESEDEDTPSRDDSVGNDKRKPHVHMPLSDPHSIENAKENTRKIIMVATIIDDVLEGVYDKLGLNYPSDEETVDEAATSPPRKENEMKAKRSRPAVNAKANTGPHSQKGKLSPIKDIPKAAPVQIPIKDDTIFPGLPTTTVVETASAVAREFPQDTPVQGSALSENGLQHRDLHLEPDFFSVPWMFDETGWDKLNRYPNREKSLLADLFLRQKRDSNGDMHVASSTAASIASSSDKGSESADSDSVTGDEKSVDDEERGGDPTSPIAPVLEEAVLEAVVASISESTGNEIPLKTLTTNGRNSDTNVEPDNAVDDGDIDVPERDCDSAAKGSFDECRSPSPHAPQTPPPQLSPILVSLADLQTIRARAVPEAVESPNAKSFSAITAESLPSSPLPASTKTLTPSWSREDLRINTFSDDQRLPNRTKGFSLKKRMSAPLSYRNVAAKTLPKPRAPLGGEGKPPFEDVAQSEARSNRSSVRSAMSIPDLRRSISSRNESDTCAQSEVTGEALSYEIPLNDTMGKTTHDNTEVTISTKDDSPLKSPSRVPAATEEIATLRDERNAFRDQCLTLGAEVAKLKNLLAAQSGSSSFVGPASMTTSSYDPEFMPPYFHGVPKATTTVGAMSDAGTHRGDHDSAFSEDGTDGFGIDSSGRPSSVHVRRMSSTATISASDLSAEQNITGQAMLGASSYRSLSRDVIGSITGHGMQSRLTTDILNFLRAKNAALKMQDKRKTMAIERLTRLVTALWPRAQVKIYGSHVTGLCLPSSDLDFVVCLPAVHKNAPAVAPGALEGRNAINESSQKTLARMLKGESWIDPRSIKIISRTIVPVIKVSTKDTRARTIQLDISFDSPDHHGVVANLMITDVMQEFPVIQPLVLVLKQFLQDRSLLTAYTGGLSSYALFLMVTRYLQEQESSWGDCGSLLMGFLDFYGNSFDPRATGISVRRRQYFPRMNYTQPQPMWDVGSFPHMTPSPPSSVGGRPDLVRRNSFNENATMDGPRFTVSGATPHAPRPPLFQPSHHRVSQQYKHPSKQAPQMTFDQAGRPYTFDPLFIEDPLSEGNNVGRNAFRIFQVQRAFSDAHRALVASLEWDIHSSQDVHDGGEYPLLNCLLQSEDVFYELDET